MYQAGCRVSWWKGAFGRSQVSWGSLEAVRNWVAMEAQGSAESPRPWRKIRMAGLGMGEGAGIRMGGSRGGDMVQVRNGDTEGD